MGHAANNTLISFRSNNGPKELCSLAVCTLGILLVVMGQTLAEDATKFPDAVRVLAREQSLAESYVVLLRDFGKDDVGRYARGIQLYAIAKAEFDGLIEQMKHNLRMGEPPEASDKFEQLMKNAAEHRIAFTSYVSKDIIGDEPERKRRAAALGALAIISTVGELIPVLKDAAIAIWQEYRKVTDQRKQEILTELDSLKWKPFHEIGGG